jgi:hypothetical protein
MVEGLANAHIDLKEMGLAVRAVRCEFISN